MLVNKGSHSHKGLQPPPDYSHHLPVSWWALRNSGRRRMPAFWHQADLHHSSWGAQRKLRMWKHRILAPHIWVAYQRNDFSEPWLLHFLLFRKVLNSLTWDVWFSLIKRILTFRPPALCCKTLIYTTSLLASWKQFSGLLEMLPPGLEVLNISCQKAHTTFRLWIYF